MKYLYFDIECCDGYHICSFGYVIVDEGFNIIEKKDIVINPEEEFRLGRDRFNPRVQLAYNEETFRKQKPFPFHYETIKNLLTRENQILLGHSISSDIEYLKNAYKKYKLPEIKIEVYDTQDFYYQLNNKYRTRKLENIIEDLKINTNNLMKHRSCDDAQMSMLVAKEICKQLNCSITELIELCDKSKRDGTPQEKTDEQKEKYFSRRLKLIAEKFPKRNEWKSICFSDSIKGKDIKLRLALVKKIFENGYNYTCKASECNFFVIENDYGERDLSCDHNIEECNKNIRKITIKELSKMLNIQINEHGEYIEPKEESNDDSPLLLAMKKALNKRGMSIEDLKSSL